MSTGPSDRSQVISPSIFSRCFPDDTCWPSTDAWNKLNDSLTGKLISTIPIGSVCHNNTDFAPSSSEKCSELRSRWSIPETHYEDPSSPMAAWWANLSCSPFLPGGGTNVQKLGRSTAPGAIALWMHNLKFTEYKPEYTSSWYTGPALRIGAGVQGHEAQAAAHRAGPGYVIMSAHSPDIGIASRYTQGGGYGPLASKYGLAVDQVLEWELVTAAGDTLTASLEQNVDLYWTPNGEGGGTYGVVLSMTVRMYPEEQTASASSLFPFDTADSRAWDVIHTFISDTLLLIDAGGMALWVLYTGPTVEDSVTFIARPLSLPWGTKEELQLYVTSTLGLLSEYNIPYYIETFPTYHASTALAAFNVTEFHVAGLLIPRSAIDSNPDGFVSVMQSLVGSGAAVSGFSVNVSRPVVHPVASNAVTPTWRKAAVSAVVGLPFDYADRYENINNQILMTHVLVPKLADFSSSTGEEVGAYMNEGDWDQRDWQNVFYGENYERLLAIKDKYDPGHIFYGCTGVGSDCWGKIRTDGYIGLEEL
ncbi:hypothetical protein BJX65DRAFT_298018 [Aspergillus insuetus]